RDLDRKSLVLFPQKSVLARQTAVLGCEGRHPLLGPPGAGLGLIPLLLAQLHSVAPETGCSILSALTHAGHRSGSRAPPPRPPTASRLGQALGLQSPTVGDSLPFLDPLLFDLQGRL